LVLFHGRPVNDNKRCQSPFLDTHRPGILPLLLRKVMQEE
jgi:hypothetical protein